MKIKNIMDELNKCSKMFIDFDGVIVDSNNFKEKAIEKSILKLYGENQKTRQAIDFFNINAGISREKKLSLFFFKEQVSEIMNIYSKECKFFLSEATTTNGLIDFLEYIKTNFKKIKLFILSGGEKEEIKFFLKKHLLFNFFEDILSSEKNKIDHLRDKEVTENDIFIGDSKNDLKASLKSKIKFILFEEYKSPKSFPKEELIKKNVFLRTKNFQSLMIKIMQ